MVVFVSIEKFILIDDFYIDERIEVESYLVYLINSITEFFDFVALL